MSEDAAAVALKPKPTISVPPRSSMESLFLNGSGPGFSPGPMTLMSSFFSEQSPFSFSQLLAGAMASPMAAKPGFLWGSDSGKEEKEKNATDDDGKNGGESGVGFKRNRPVNLVVAEPQLQLQLDSLSPMFMVPQGLSPSGFLNSPGFLSPLQSPFGMSHQQALAHVTAQAAFSPSFIQMQAELQCSSFTEPTPNHLTSAPNDTMPKESKTLKVESPEISQSERKNSCGAGDKPASDGYNWRKYGQKQVKTSECPRSYYKCTYINCSVKKKVERSIDGRVSEITYKGQHNHDPPQTNKRGKDSGALDRATNSQVNEAVIVNFEPQNFHAIEHRPVASHNGGTEDPTIVLDDDEPTTKRRIVETGSSMPASSHQTVTVTEAKIVVQTRSEVDLLDDGYKWRKYGQKVVKGNLHPRSYYRCTYAGCNVRKHVERASADPKAVITTYEGKHDHDIPVGKYSSHWTGNANAQPVKNTKECR